ncbi:MAG: hypothetical protein PGN12_16530 [Sphingomonas phyllosphaerae]
MASLPIHYDFFNESESEQFGAQWNEKSTSFSSRSKISLVPRPKTAVWPKKVSPLPEENASLKSGTQVSEEAAKLSASNQFSLPAFTFRPTTIGVHSMNTLQEWEGLIIDVRGDGFSARLKDLTDRNRREELAEFDFDAVDKVDLVRVREGAVFHLIVGYTRRSGARRLETIVYFRRHLAKSNDDAGNFLADLLDEVAGDVD